MDDSLMNDYLAQRDLNASEYRSFDNRDRMLGAA